jgi:hypothetical protein
MNQMKFTASADLLASGELRLWLPLGLDLHEMLPARLWKHADGTKVIVDRLAVANVNRPDGGIRLPYKLAAKIVGNERAWSGVRRSLRAKGLIECGEPYRRGCEAKSYRLAAGWRNRAVEPVSIRSPKLTERLARLRVEGRKHWAEVHRWLEVNLEAAAVDQAQARRWVCRTGSRRQRRAALALGMLEAGDPRMSVDRFGRVHHAVSRMPSRLRSCLTLNDEATVEQDIAASQPLLLAGLTMHRFRAGTTDRQTEEGLLSLIMCCKIAPIARLSPTLDHARMPSDLEEFLELCEGGGYYPEFAEVFGVPFGTAAEQRRAKLWSCKVIFGRDRPRDPRWAAFRIRWPAVQESLDWLKARNHRHAARVLQRIEAALMVGRVSNRLRRSHPDLPIIGVHDSIIVACGAADLVRNAIEMEWGAIGLRPLIRRKA